MKKHNVYKVLMFALLAVLPLMMISNAEADLGKYLFQWGSLGVENGQFYNPSGIAVSANGNVYVADTWNSRIQVFDSMGNHLDTWGGDGPLYRGAGTGNGQFWSPCGIAVDADGNVYIADTSNYRIQVFDSNGNYLLKWGGWGEADGQFKSPRGIAVGANGNVYVVDFQYDRIQVFDSNGNYLFQWGSQGGGDGQFYYAWGIAADTSGNVYVADGPNHRVQVFDSEGHYLRKWYGLIDPYGIAVDADGKVYVANSGRHNIKVFDSGGTLLRAWGGLGSGDGQFLWPYAIALGVGGNVYVADSANDRVQVFDGLGNNAPLADAGPDQTIECAGPDSASVTLDGSGSFDLDGDTLTYSWTGQFGTASGVSPTVTLPLGVHTVTLTVDDGVSGTSSDTVTVTVRDTTPPSTSAVIEGVLGENGWYVSDVTVTLISTDSCSGVKEVHYAVNGVETVVPGDTATFTLAEDGIHTVSYWAVDNADNTETASSTPVQRETAPPVTTPTIPPPPPGTGGHYTGCVNVELDTDSGSSGTAVTQYSFDGVTWHDYNGQFPVCDDGSTDVYYKAKSNAGNKETPKTITIKIDTTTPVTSHTLSGTMGSDGWYVSDAVVTLTATDATSGVAEIHYVLDGVETVVSGGSTSFTVSADGMHSLTYWAKDFAGNTEAGQGPVGFKIDQTPPVITVLNVVDNGVYALGLFNSPGYEVTDGPSGSGVASAEPSLTGGDGLGLGQFTYSVTATDTAGNSDTVTVNYQVTGSVDGLQALVTDYTASGDIEAPLSDELQLVLGNAENAPNSNEEDGYLQDFINKVDAQSGKKVSASVADILVHAAEYVIANN